MALVDISYNKLAFDDTQEADIANFVNKLKASHKIGEYLSNLIRISFDNPELMTPESLEKLTKGYSQTAMRQEFFDGILKEVNEMHDKIDKMYSMVVNMYMLAQMGKTLGLEEKSKNALMAQFIIEKQFKELQDLVGGSMVSNVLASNKVQNIEKIAEEALQYIINSYSGIVSELKQLQEVQIVAPVAQVENTNNNSVKSVNVTESTPVSTVESKPEVEKSTADNTEEYIDFGDADLDVLKNFFGEGN